MPDDGEVQRALELGARRSREACALTRTELVLFQALNVPGGTVTQYRTDLAAPRREALTPEVLWRRFKWPIIALGMFILIELLSMGKLISVMGTHF